MKEIDLMSQIEVVFRQLGDDIPLIQSVNIAYSSKDMDGYQPDMMVELGGVAVLVVEAKKVIQPRHMHGIAMKLKQYVSGKLEFPCVVTPYISEKTADICKTYDINYLDLSGNCLLSLPHVYIEKSGNLNVEAEKRELRSLFSMKSSRILQVMLNKPVFAWRVQELAKEAKVSFGQVSNVRRRLLDLEYASDQTVKKSEKEKGIKLTQPSVLLHDWQREYKKRVEKSQGYYSLLDKSSLNYAIKTAFDEAKQSGAQIVLSGFSAAKLMAPYAKSSSESFYADAAGERILISKLELKAVSNGANIIVERPKDDFLMQEITRNENSLSCTNPVQTYLDISIAGERGLEAAEHLESFRLKDIWSGYSA